jgi:hypothetical protein
MCIQECCDKRPCYNLEAETKALYCASHKLENMVDVKHETCIQEGCKKIPNFNLEREIKSLYC